MLKILGFIASYLISYLIFLKHALFLILFFKKYFRYFNFRSLIIMMRPQKVCADVPPCTTGLT